MLNVIVIGYGYWGKNIARDIHANEHMHLEAIVEPQLQSHSLIARLYPEARVLSSMSGISPAAAKKCGIFVCTPPQQHSIVLEQLKANGAKQVCITKPYCLSAEDARKYSDIVKMVDYTFLFSNAVKRLPEFLDELGMIHHVSCVRANLGKVQDCGVLSDLCVHDLSILKSIGFHLDPIKSHSAVSPMIADTMYLGSRGIYSNVATIHVHNSWLSHLKRKTMIFTCERGTLVYNDNEPVDKITIYDNYIENPEDPALMQYKYGDTRIPYIGSNNPLGSMVDTFGAVCKEGLTHETVNMALEIHDILEQLTNED